MTICTYRGGVGYWVVIWGEEEMDATATESILCARLSDASIYLFTYLLIVGLSHKTDNSFLSYNVPEL